MHTYTNKFTSNYFNSYEEILHSNSVLQTRRTKRTYWGTGHLIIHIPYPMRTSKIMPVSRRNEGLHESRGKLTYRLQLDIKINFQPRQSAEAKRV